VPPRSAPEVAVGSTWFVWGDHFYVKEEGAGDRITLAGGESYRERVVRLVPRDEKRAKQFRKGKGRWVADWRVAKYGSPSLAYS
jgi:hypothetical protein